MQHKFSPSTGRTLSDTETFATLESTTLSESTLSVEDSLARTLATLEKEQDSTANEADCSLNLCESLARWDQESLSWKTSQRCLLGGWIEYSGRWPRSGLMRNGIAYRLRPLVLISEATACLSLPVVPRPVACDGKGSGRVREERGANNNLRDWWNKKYGFVYPPVRFSEYLMGFPIGYTELEDSATQ